MLVFPEKTTYENVPAGSYSALCYRVIDLGHQFSSFYQKSDHKILISWELDELMKDGRPFQIGKRYTLSSGKKANLRKDLESWRGVPFTDEDYGTFDLGKLIGKSCMIGVTQMIRDGETRSDVTSIMKLPKNTNPLPPVNEQVYFSLNDFRQEIYDKLTEGLRATIAKSPEFCKLKGGKTEDETGVSEEPSPPDERDYGESVPF